MGWATDVAPNVHQATLQPRKDKGTPIADGVQDDGSPVTITVIVDVMTPGWKERNGFGIESQMIQLSADDDAPALGALVKGARVRIESLGMDLVTMERARYAPVTDYPLAEVMCEDQRQGGIR